MQVDQRKAGIILILISLGFSIIYLFLENSIIQVLQRFISPDGNITPQGELQLTLIFYFFIGLIFLLGLILSTTKERNWLARMRQILLSEPLVAAPVKPSPTFFLWASFLISLFLMIHIRLYDPDSQIFAFLYLEDGLFESLTPVLFLISVGLLAASVFRKTSNAPSPQFPKYLRLVYLLLMGIFFLYAMEEISWGQRIFGWETPDFIAAGNVQNETNLHNFFNIYFLSLYRLLVFFPAPIFISIWLELRGKMSSFRRLVLPAPHLVGSGLLVAFVALVWPQSQELLEEMVSVFVFFYCLRIFVCFRAMTSGYQR